MNLPESTAAPIPGTDLSPASIIVRAVEYPVGWKNGVPRWSAVGAIFCCGSGYAIKICEAAGFNPHEVKQPRKPARRK